MFSAIFSKLVAEGLLSLYPIFVKNIGLPLSLQVWSRVFSYTAISAFFIDYPFVLQNLFSKNGILLSLITLIHIYTSYRGFQLLESGVSYTLFYIYPILILLFSKQGLHPVMLLSLLGVFLLSYSPSPAVKVAAHDQHKEDFVESSAASPTASPAASPAATTATSTAWNPEGYIMILLAALTEALIYFVVRNIKTENSWNHIFLSYFLGAGILSVGFSPQILGMNLNSSLSWSLGINVVIGLFGYLLRFFAISRLEPMLYAPLSYFGVFMAYVYGIFIQKDTITLQKILGTLMIILPNVYLVLSGISK
jgi:drug/metabolite transporter (DMT)-like permease